MRQILYYLLLFLCLAATADTPKPHYIVGTGAINFYPHYHFGSPTQSGFANDVLALFAKESGYNFSYQPLPVKRLYHEIDQQVDFVYPDHPAWVEYQLAAPPVRYFSDSIVKNIGTAMVRQELRYASLARIKSVAIIRGFTPVAWLGLPVTHKINLIEVPDPESAIGLVLRGRVDAADVEYNVAHHILQKQGHTLFAAKRLPYTLGNYHLSTVKHPEVIAQFNLFLKTHQQKISQLKQKYHIIEDFSLIP